MHLKVLFSVDDAEGEGGQKKINKGARPLRRRLKTEPASSSVGGKYIVS